MFQIPCVNGHWIELDAHQLGERLVCPICDTYVYLKLNSAGEPGEPRYEFLCPSGHILRVKAKYLGREARCPSCDRLVQIRARDALRQQTQSNQFSSDHSEIEEVAEPEEDRVLEAIVVPTTQSKPLEVRNTENRKRKNSEYDEEEEIGQHHRKRRRKRSISNSGLGIVRTGLNLMRLALIIACICSGVSFLMLMLTYLLLFLGVGPGGLIEILGGIVLLCSGVSLLCALMGFIGFLLQFAVPGESKCLIWLIGSVLMCVISPILVIFVFGLGVQALIAIDIRPGAARLGEGVNYVIMVVLLLVSAFLMSLPWICFMMHLKQLATYLKEHNLASEALLIIGLGLGIIYFFLIVLLIASPILPKLPPVLAGMIGLVVMLGYLISAVLLLIKQIQLLTGLMYACDDHL